MSKRRLSPCSRLAFVAVAAAGAYAAIPDSGGVIHGCYQRDEGLLRVLDASQTCRSSEVGCS